MGLPVPAPPHVILRSEKNIMLHLSLHGGRRGRFPALLGVALASGFLGLAGSASRAALVVPVASSGTVAGVNNYPSAESPSNVRDANSGTKYLNFAKLNTGFIESFPAAVITNGINFSSANDAAERDPTTFNLYGSNSIVITGTEPAGSNIDFSSFVPITLNQATNLSTTRLLATGDQAFANTTAYRTYAVLFPTVRDASAANSMQVGDATFDLAGTAIANQTSNPVVGVPEPASLGLFAVGGLGLLARRRKANC
jgi:hypothetical protein